MSTLDAITDAHANQDYRLRKQLISEYVAAGGRQSDVARATGLTRGRVTRILRPAQRTRRPVIELDAAQAELIRDLITELEAAVVSSALDSGNTALRGEVVDAKRSVAAAVREATSTGVKYSTIAQRVGVTADTLKAWNRI
jgi:transposase-like protein